MERKRRYHRPPFEDALSVWQALLGKRGLATDLVWVFDENICFERDPKAP